MTQFNIFKKLTTITSLTLALALPAMAEESTSLTIYSKATPGSVNPDMYRPLPGGQNTGWYYSSQIPGYAMVRQQRDVEIGGKRIDLTFSDVAALIDPTTVSFKSLTAPDNTKVLEQNYHFDLVNNQKLLERYLGQDITVEQSVGESIQTYSGKLLSAQGGLILQDETGKVTSIMGYSNIRFPDLPGGLITRPTLIWDIYTEQPGRHNIEASYQTGGITWWADYNAVFEEGRTANEGFLDLGAWVSIINKSGATYDNAKLKLIAGDVHRAPQRGLQPRHARKSGMLDMAMEASSIAGFEEKSFFEFHLYTLGRPATIPDNSTKQIELFPKASKIPVEKKYVYYGLPNWHYYGGTNTNRDLGIQMNKKVDVYLKFKNEEKHGLGIPLPSGRLRVSKLDTADGSLEFIGEDIIDHTPKNEKVQIKLGSAFDIVGERRQMDFKIDTSRKWMEETIEIKLRNHKDEDAEVIVKENLYRAANWKILSNTGKYEKQDAFTVHFPVKVKADGKEVVRYTVKYTW